MKLFHGTNTVFTDIGLRKCRPNKDFGRGFYLTDIFRQAQEMAVRRCEFSGEGTPVVLQYEFDENTLTNGSLNVKVFNCVSVEWALFVMKNRQSRGQKTHNYDIVVGPVADDGVVYQLNLYSQHIITVEQLVNQLTCRKLNRQYYFGTKRAVSKLTRL